MLETTYLFYSIDVAVPIKTFFFFLVRTDPRVDWQNHISRVREIDKNIVSSLTFSSKVD